ncbi:hypothetical protein K431DRAFT_294969 [Polychaeton citri CBS 116435]|uniref:Ankyrin n=1 Tax=Polychaeton citri CBS 116435 TaxID=1314669 RepID=A0A9P4ULZ5_9PEZI|nr:hypothetical protein K431DRAFT_294969 [Polychaeton citri CBS 116435]
MQVTSNLRCADPRDKVYAILGVAKTGSEQISPDYRTSLVALLNAVLGERHELKRPGSLEEVMKQCHHLSAMTKTNILKMSSADIACTEFSNYMLGRRDSPITLLWASVYGHQVVIDLLLQERAVEFDALVLEAAFKGNELLLKILIDI